MTADFEKLSESLQRETQESLLKREIKEKSNQIAEQLKESGVYEDLATGLRISVA